MILAGAAGGLSRRMALAWPLVLAPLAIANAADAQAAAPIVSLTVALLAVMKAGRGVPFPQRFATLAPVIDRSFDLAAILRSSVGPRFESLPADQKNRLLETFRTFTVASYVANFDSAAGGTLDVLPEQRSVGDNLVVQTVFTPAHGEAIHIDYVMHRSEQGWQAIDVLLNGSISQNAVKRSDFRILVSASSAQPLIDSLQRKVADLSGGTLS